MAPRHTPKRNPWGLDGTKYRGLFIVEYLQPNKFKERPGFDHLYQVSCFSSLGNASCFHVFPGKGRLSLSARWKNIMFSGKKLPSFQIIQERSCSSAIFLERPSFQGVRKRKIWFFMQCCYLTHWFHFFRNCKVPHLNISNLIRSDFFLKDIKG